MSSAALVGLAVGFLLLCPGSVEALMQPLGSGYDEPSHMIMAVGTAHRQWGGNGRGANYKGDLYQIF